MLKFLTFAAIFLALGAGKAHAEPAKNFEFTCRYYGQDYERGGQICLSTPKGLRRASCGMALNNTTWIIHPESCAPATKKKRRATSKALKFIEEYLKDTAAISK